ACLLQPLEDDLTIGGIRLVAGRTKGGTWRAGDQPQPVLGNRGKVDIVAVTDAAHAVDGTEDLGTGMPLADLQRRPDHRLVDDGGWTAALSDDKSSGHS